MVLLDASAQIEVHTAPEKQNYESQEQSYKSRILTARFSPQTDSLLRELWYHSAKRDEHIIDSANNHLRKKLNVTRLNFYSKPDIQTRYTTEKRFSVNGMLIDSAGRIVLQAALKGFGEVRTIPVLTEIHTKIDLKTARKIKADVNPGDTLKLPSLQMERTTLKGVTAVVQKLDENAQILAGQNILTLIKVSMDHQFFKYSAEPQSNAKSLDPNLYYADAAFLGAHDGNGNNLLYELRLNEPRSKITDEKCLKFFMKDVDVEWNRSHLKDAEPANQTFKSCGSLGTDLFRGRKVSLDLRKGSLKVFPRKNILPDGIYAVAGTFAGNEQLNHSAVEVIVRAEEFIRPGESTKPKEIAVYTHDFVPLDLESAPDELAEEGQTVAVRLYFSEKLTEKLERFTADFNGGHIALVIAGSAVTMQPVYGKVEGLKSVDVTGCTPAAARYLHLHLQNKD